MSTLVDEIRAGAAEAGITPEEMICETALGVLAELGWKGVIVIRSDERNTQRSASNVPDKIVIMQILQTEVHHILASDEIFQQLKPSH